MPEDLSTTHNTIHNLRRIVGSIIRSPLDYGPWSIQGLGMLRLYLDDETRLHFWSPAHATPGVTLIHTHPWDFRSTVIYGRLVDMSYECLDASSEEAGTRALYSKYHIRCGEGGGPEGEPSTVILSPPSIATISAPGTYHRDRSTPHATYPEEGTVTLVRRRVPADLNPDYAFVYVPMGLEFISAEPRGATDDEVKRITSLTFWRWAAHRA